ncbi:ORF1 [Torque teno Leptonychotes weddellii virus-1]|uniref:Capsid protein n=1 Tax=Torque teno Leptonychotes weddellii virus-1 TaxID=2012676 RepID=A0A1Z2RVY6_9VIRU|nr:ORF1 [Torque teno Leptonychotes weddellii virus 1]ASA48733.1 ORF1 [Torque teno Leptonychotes weddellii virus 1]
MAYRRRRWRKPRRSRWRTYRRNRYWRRPHRRHWRRRRYIRPRTATVRYYPSRRRKRISVRGWEPLGNVCSSDIASSEATPYTDLDMYDLSPLEDDTRKYKGKWHGTWGHHFFTLRSLLVRAKYYFNYWSSDWEGYDYVKFKGGYIWIPRMTYFSWIFYLDSSIQSNPREDGEPEAKYKYEKSWLHPGILLNRPGSKLMISSLQQPNRPFYRRIKVTPPSAWEGNYRMDTAMDYLLFHWGWTVCNVTASFFDFFCQRKRSATHNDTCPTTPWFIHDSCWKQGITANEVCKAIKEVYDRINKRHLDPRSVWVNRKMYIKSDCVNTPNSNSVPSNCHNWGPFLPQNVILETSTGNSLYFRYKLFFEVSGDSLYRRQPSQPCKDGVIPPAPGAESACPEISTRSIYKKKKRPQSIYDILQGDLDSDGMLTERAYERITGDNRCDQPTRMGDVPHRVPPRKRVRFRLSDRKLQHRKRELIRILLGRRDQPRGGGSPPSPPPVEEPLDLLLNFPK